MWKHSWWSHLNTMHDIQSFFFGFINHKLYEFGNDPIKIICFEHKTRMNVDHRNKILKLFRIVFFLHRLWLFMEFFFVMSLLLPQVNGWACVDFGCTHPIDGLFWSLPIYLLGLFSKYECWITDLIMPLYHFYFWGCHLPVCITRFHITMKC
jgi:hypothetical protein